MRLALSFKNHTIFVELLEVYISLPVPVAARSKAWVCGLSPAGIVGSNPTEGMDVRPL